ncbi:MAG: ATP-dependent DNA helicase RecQ [Cyclobacteriaceae bacterium]
MHLNDPLSILKQYWGYSSFRPLQQEIIESVTEGHHTLALLPTGGGKSICFQVPGLCLDGICIVVSPLIALMKDQVEQLRSRGIKAEALFSGMSKREIDITLDNCIYGDIKFLYVSPERLRTELFLERAKKMKIGLLAIDEAHCISQWGYDFRPPYMQIADFIQEFHLEKLIAVTASATKEVKEDILSKLLFKAPRIFKKSFARANLSYSVFDLENKEAKMMEILNNVPGTGIVYVRSRKRTQLIAEKLRRNGVSADYYHAGLSPQDRVSRQEAWIRGQIRVIVSTNAFGMGIDKPDVRSVIHYDLPDSLEAYYQEAGRAGRDEKKAYAVILYHQGDIEDLETRTEKSAVEVSFIKRVYQALANYYKLAVGSNALSSFDFLYADFTATFNLPLVETYHALSKLEDEGLIQITDAYREASRVLMLLKPEELYKFQVAHENFDALIKVLLRLYGGELYVGFVNIKEQDISKLVKESVPKVIKDLEYLQKLDVLEYHHGSDQAQITFLTPRYDANNLPLDKKQIAWRRQVTMEKAKSVAKYAQNVIRCRTQIIQEYFDEQTDQECGVCDVCLEKRKKTTTIGEKEIMSVLSRGEHSVQQLKKTFPNVGEEQIIQVLRMLMDEGLVIENHSRFGLKSDQPKT